MGRIDGTLLEGEIEDRLDAAAAAGKLDWKACAEIAAYAADRIDEMLGWKVPQPRTRAVILREIADLSAQRQNLQAVLDRIDTEMAQREAELASATE